VCSSDLSLARRQACLPQIEAWQRPREAHT
jgi:hypothetical protein